MTNNELRLAIEDAERMLSGCGQMYSRHRPLLEHLQALLAEQRRRALAPQPAAPLPPLWATPVIVQPTFVPQQPWAPGQPPWVVTCGNTGFRGGREATA